MKKGLRSSLICLILLVPLLLSALPASAVPEHGPSPDTTPEAEKAKEEAEV